MLHLADISRELKLPHTNVRQYMAEFEKKGILKKTILGRLSFYQINKEAPMIEDYLSILEKSKLINKSQNNLRLKELASSLHKDAVGVSCLIFGSSAENEKTSNDIDLLVVGKKDISAVVKGVEARINKKIHLVHVPSLLDVSDALKEEIRKKHLIINGSEEIIRWLL
jgi:predicted nucleotidyltransferase